jgi:hypothetical protein
MVHLTPEQTISLFSSAGAAFLMVRAGTAKKLLEQRARPRCASCGRRLTRSTCRCAAPTA